MCLLQHPTPGHAPLAPRDRPDPTWIPPCLLPGQAWHEQIEGPGQAGWAGGAAAAALWAAGAVLAARRRRLALPLTGVQGVSTLRLLLFRTEARGAAERMWRERAKPAGAELEETAARCRHPCQRSGNQLQQQRAATIPTSAAHGGSCCASAALPPFTLCSSDRKWTAGQRPLPTMSDTPHVRQPPTTGQGRAGPASSAHPLPLACTWHGGNESWLGKGHD